VGSSVVSTIDLGLYQLGLKSRFQGMGLLSGVSYDRPQDKNSDAVASEGLTSVVTKKKACNS